MKIKIDFFKTPTPNLLRATMDNVDWTLLIEQKQERPNEQYAKLLPNPYDRNPDSEPLALISLSEL